LAAENRADVRTEAMKWSLLYAPGVRRKTVNHIARCLRYKKLHLWVGRVGDCVIGLRCLARQ
jgi:hypothetical protein